MLKTLYSAYELRETRFAKNIKCRGRHKSNVQEEDDGFA